MGSGARSLEALLGDARWLRALSRRLVQDASAADDLLQDAWVAALEHPPADVEAGRAWFERVLERLWRMRWRAERARTGREHASARAERLDSAAEVVSRAELQRWLVGHVLALDEPYRATILLRYFDGLSGAAIARRAGVPESTVRNRLARGLAELRARLERERGRAWAGVLVPLAATRTGVLGKGLGLGVGVLAMEKALSLAVVVAVLVLLWFAVPRASDGPSSPIGVVAAPGEELVRAGAAVHARREAPGPLRESLKSGNPAPRAPAADEITGRVLTTAGEPLDGASVRVVVPRTRQWPLLFFEPVAEADVPLAETRTDAQGEFRVHAASDHVLDVYAEVEGYATEKRPGVYAGGRVELVLARAAALVGRVTRTSDGTPVEGARLLLEEGVMSLPGRVERRATTDARGEYRFDGLDPGWYHASVHSAHEVRVGFTFSVGEGDETRKDLVFPSGTVISGRVTDGRDESPLAGARVWIWGGPDEAAVSDEDGRYRLEGIEINSTSHLHVSCEGFGAFQAARYVGKEGLRQDFYLLPGRSARGRIIDAAGTPIAGAYVAAGSLTGTERMDGLWTVSGTNGRFTLADLRIDLRHSLLVRAPGHSCAVFDFPAHEFEQTEIELGDLALESPSLVRGRLVDRAGRALAGFPVWVDIDPLARDRLGPTEEGEGYFCRGGLGTGEIHAPTDADGRFAFADLPAGHWRIRADAKGYVHAAEVEFDLAPGERRTELELVLDTGLSISGRVVDEEGRPLPGSIVSVHALGDRERLIADLARDDGSFSVHGLEPGRYRLWVDGDGLYGSGAAWCEVECDAGEEDVRIRVGRATDVRVRVVDRDGGPLPGANVGVGIGMDQFSMQPSDEEGRTTIRVPAHAAFDLCASANPTFDPGASFFEAFFRDENGRLDESMSVTVTGLVAGPDEIVLTIPGLP